MDRSLSIKKGRSALSRTRYRILPAIALLLASCGGSGGSPTPSPGGGSGGSSITLTSSTSASVAENASGTVYTASATATGGRPVTFAIYAGPDMAKFAMTSDGALRFVTPPDFEKPGDNDKNNVYQVSISATAGSDVRNFSVSITVTNDKEGVSVKRIATGFVDPVCVDFLVEEPAPTAGPQGRIGVGEKSGKMYAIDGSTGQRTLLGNALAGRAGAEVIECKTFLRVRTMLYAGFYAAVREANGRVSMQRYDRDPLRETELLPAGTPKTAISLINTSNGEFYMAVGDIEGGAAQNETSPLGKLFWLQQGDPYSGASVQPGYFIPRIIGDGIRDPAGGGAIGSLTAFADRASTGEEEITGFDPRARPLDFGWPYYEGGVAVRSNPPASVNEPMIAYPHGSGATAGQGIVFGASYLRDDIPSLRNHYVWGDVDGTIWSISLSLLLNGYRHLPEDFLDRTADFMPDAGKIDSPVGFATDDFNRLYILDSDGELFRVDAG